MTRPRSTTTTPESRGRIAYTAYCKSRVSMGDDWSALPSFDEQSPENRQAWITAAQVLWDLATTGQATL
jgi:hypothetical protein